MSTYTNTSQQRIIRLLLLLAGNEIEGLSATDIATSLNVSTGMAFRDLKNLEETGVAEQLENNNWRLTPKVVQISIAYSQNIQRATNKLNETQNRYSRIPH